MVSQYFFSFSQTIRLRLTLHRLNTGYQRGISSPQSPFKYHQPTQRLVMQKSMNRRNMSRRRRRVKLSKTSFIIIINLLVTYILSTLSFNSKVYSLNKERTTRSHPTFFAHSFILRRIFSFARWPWGRWFIQELCYYYYKMCSYTFVIVMIKLNWTSNTFNHFCVL